MNAEEPQWMDFSSAYSHTPPWDIGRPQRALTEIADQFRGRVLDIGCGTGEHALFAASRGLEATGIDTVSAAIDTARRKAGERGVVARFVVASALDGAALGEQFETVLDCGLFHVFSNDERTRYVANLAATILPGGRFFMLCFSDRQEGVWGPRRVSEAEIRDTFAEGWRVDSVEPSTIETTNLIPDIDAWLTSITRV